MAILDSVKPFWPLLFTFVLPRALGYYQALKTAYRTRPPPRPLPPKANRALNILFVSACFFLWISTSGNSSWSEYRNVFARTQTRLHVPTDILFARIAASRPSGTLTARDEELRLKLLTVPARQIYLRYGPDTLLDCPFCHVDLPWTYLLHYFPGNILLPHLIHLVTVGLATSSVLCGRVASRFRAKFVGASAVLLALDVYVSTAVDLPLTATALTPRNPSPQSLFVATSIARPLSLAVGDAILAFLVYVSATGRFIFFPFLAAASANATDQNPEDLVAATDKILTETNLALQTAHMKLRGLNVARNTVVRDATLKAVDDAYWETVRVVEGNDDSGGGGGGGGGGVVDDESVFEDEEVQAAMARAFGSGNVDVERLRRDARGFVDHVTKGLDGKSTSSSSR